MWQINWSGKTHNFPGVQELIKGFENAEQAVVEQAAQVDQIIKDYFANHPGKHGAVAVEAEAIENGAHSATITLAAIPAEHETPTVTEPAAEQTQEASEPDTAVSESDKAGESGQQSPATDADIDTAAATPEQPPLTPPAPETPAPGASASAPTA